MHTKTESEIISSIMYAEVMYNNVQMIVMVFKTADARPVYAASHEHV